MFNEYPYVNLQDVNLDWILKHIKDLETNLQDFVKLNTIKYADPIIWNITKQYETNTVVIDGNTGTAYISVQPVPAGVALTNTDYWTVVFTLNLTTSNQNITLRDDGTNVIATFPSDTGDWILWNFYLYRVTQPIAINTAYLEGFNLERYTVELFVKDYVTHILNLIGDLDDLNTTDKDSVVNAINEVINLVNTTVTNIGDLSDLDTTDKDNLVDAINEVLGIAADPLNTLIPDDFTGTDGEKIQSAFDALALTGGTIVLTRAYTLDRNITVHHRTNSPNHKTITVIGIGETAEINFDTYSITGYDTNYVDYGGLVFLNVKMHGSEKAFITDNLIRIHLNACAVWDFKYVFYGTDYSQSIFVNDCTINQIKTCVMYVLRFAWDTHFTHNRIELCESVFNVNVANTAVFQDNVIESYSSDTPLNRKQFVIRNIARAFLVQGNYFEDNERTIDLTDMTNNVINAVSIRDNMFVEPSRNTGAICIKLPDSAITSASIMIENNSFALRDNSQYAISVTGNHTLTNVVVNNCHGENYQVYDPDHMLHDLANYNNDTFTRVVDATNNTAIPPEFRRFGKYCMFNGTVTLNENVAAGATIFKLDNIYNAPPTQRFGTLYKMSGGAIASTHRANIEANGNITCQEALTSGTVISFVCNWICH